MNSVIEMVLGSRRVCALVALSVTLVLSSCDTADLLSVDLPGNVTADDIEKASLANTIRVSAIGDFEWAWDEYVDFAAGHSDEYIQSSGNFTGRRLQLRDIPADLPQYQDNIFGRLHRARIMLESNFDRLEAFTDAEVSNRRMFQAEMRTYGGFVYVAFGEGFCGTPLNGDGVVRTSDQLLQIAVDQFTEALSLASSVSRADLINAARIGRARAYVDLKNYSSAIQDAEQVVEGLDFYATRESGEDRRANSMANRNQLSTSRQSSVAPGYQGLQWKGVADPRVNATETRFTGHDGSTIVWRHDKTPENYTAGAGQDVIVASYREARLIIAEASALTDDLPRAIGILNDLHTAAGIPPVDAVDLPTQDDVIRHVIEERRREFFIEGGHRQRDHLRWRGGAFNVPYLGEVGSDHPTGIDHQGQIYGQTTCFLVAQNEQIGT
jgi:hypothetical protein